jgi:hypothetical protein
MFSILSKRDKEGGGEEGREGEGRERGEKVSVGDIDRGSGERDRWRERNKRVGVERMGHK